jgi:hypothetical protein
MRAYLRRVDEIHSAIRMARRRNSVAEFRRKIKATPIEGSSSYQIE